MTIKQPWNVLTRLNQNQAPEQFHNVIIVKFAQFILILICYARINNLFFQMFM